MEKEVLIQNIDRLHTTEGGAERIKRNLVLAGVDAVEFCRGLILAKDCQIERNGKNWYCTKDGNVITVNAASYTIITAHKQKKERRPVVLVSACLLGDNCKYSGGNNYSEKLVSFLKEKKVVKVCPEVLGGLSVPRKPCEIVDGMVRTKEGISCDREFREGAKLALETALEEKVDFAVLQSRSPSCGLGTVYDGTFSKTLREGNGVFAVLLLENGIRVVDVADL